MTEIVELVTFRLARPGAPGFVDANAALNGWLSRQPGFVSRTLAERDDGQFLDIVFWRSHAEALAASARLTAEMADDAALAMIDPMSVSMTHAAVRLTAQ